MRKLRIWVLLTLVTLLVSCGTPTKIDSSRSPAQTAEMCTGIKSLAIENFNWPAFKYAMSSQSITKIDQAMCLIPRDDHFAIAAALMVNSRSLQRSSVEYPRMVLFLANTDFYNRDTLFMSYNGENTLEFLRADYRRQNKKIEMAEIRFEKDGPHISENTPATCVKCHGIEPQFLWSERDFWPAAAKGLSIYRTDEEFEKMKAAAGKLPLYHVGINRNSLSTLNHHASQINSYRLQTKFFSSPDYQYYKFAILGGILGCTVPDFIPENLRALHQNVSFAQETNPAKAAKLISNYLVSISNDFKGYPGWQKGTDIIAERIFPFTHRYHQDQWVLTFGQTIDANIKKTSSSVADDAYGIYLADQMRIITDKLNFGMLKDMNSPLDVIFSKRAGTNLRYLFEGRGIGIDNWSYDDILGTYHFSVDTMALGDISFAQRLIKADPELSFAETKEFAALDNGQRDDVLQGLGTAFTPRLCQSLRERSLQRLSELKNPQTFSLKTVQNLSQQNWKHHFSDIAKINNLPLNLPTNPQSSQSCTQCHFGYKANYTGPKFERETQKFPLAFMVCANCHSDPGFALFAPQIPFNNEKAFREFLHIMPEYATEIGYRLSDKAKARLEHMPPVYRLPQKDKVAIRKYLQSL